MYLKTAKRCWHFELLFLVNCQLTVPLNSLFFCIISVFLEFNLNSRYLDTCNKLDVLWDENYNFYRIFRWIFPNNSSPTAPMDKIEEICAEIQKNATCFEKISKTFLSHGQVHVFQLELSNVPRKKLQSQIMLNWLSWGFCKLVFCLYNRKHCRSVVEIFHV